MEKRKEIRCNGTMLDRYGDIHRCGRMLLRIGRNTEEKETVEIEVKCPKCGKINRIRY